MDYGLSKNDDIEKLWGKVGLEELQRAVDGILRLTHDFEETLKGLPSCNQCAKAEMLERIRVAGTRLSSEAVSLSVLAESLKKAAEIAEKSQECLTANPPSPCRCPTGGCVCHG